MEDIKRELYLFMLRTRNGFSDEDVFKLIKLYSNFRTGVNDDNNLFEMYEVLKYYNDNPDKIESSLNAKTFKTKNSNVRSYYKKKDKVLLKDLDELPCSICNIIFKRDEFRLNTNGNLVRKCKKCASKETKFYVNRKKQREA